MNRHPNWYDALKWVTRILNQLGIPYQVVGGLAAKCYGSRRPLYDIDFYVPARSILKLKEELDEFVEFGPKRHKDEYWDIVFMKLDYYGKQIEFGDADRTKYFDSQTGEWIEEKIDFSASVIRDFEGLKLPVMPKEQLIEYKKRLNRRVDQIDLEEIL